MAWRAAADPAIEVKSFEDGPEAAVAISELDPQVTYWITLIAPGEEDGAFGPFEYIVGVESTRIVFDAVPGPAEWRLHLSDGPAAPIARVTVTVPSPDTASVPAATDPALVAHAQEYGLVGRWNGGFTCEFGRAEMEITVRPGLDHSDYEYVSGVASVRMVEGPYAGGSGSGPIKMQRREGGASVNIVPQEVIDIGAGPYRLSQIKPLTLDADGLRLQGDGPQLRGCRDFVLTRMPLPTESAAMAAVDSFAAAGFAGIWEGTYVCGAAIALELTFARDPVLRRPVARWIYTGEKFQGRHDFEVEAAGPGEIVLRPLHWVQRPRGHLVSDVKLRRTPDGRSMQGSFSSELSQCQPFSLSPRREAPETGPGAAAVSAGALPSSLAGAWEGLGRCAATDAIVRLDLPSSAGGMPEGGMRIMPVSGPGILRGPERVRVIPRTAGRLSLRAVAPGGTALSIQPDAVEMGRDGPRLTFRSGCEPVTLGRPTGAETARDVVPAAPGAPAVLNLNGDSALQVAEDAMLCTALAGWSGRLTGEARRIDVRGQAGWGGWPKLFTDPIFAEAFGISFSEVAGTPALGERLLAAARGCAGAVDEATREALGAAFAVTGPSPDQFGSDAHRFRAAVRLEAPAIVEAVDLIARIGSLDPADRPAIRRLAATVRQEAFPLADLRTRATAALDAKTAEADRVEAREILAAVADGVRPATREALLAAEGALSALPRDEVAEWRERLASAAQQVAAGIDTSTDPAAATASYAGLIVYPAIASRLDEIARHAEAERARLGAIADAERERLRTGIDEATTIPALHRLRTEIERAGAGVAGDLWAAFDRRAATLLSEAVADLPPVAESAAAEAAMAPAGLNEGRLIAAFLLGDPVVPYRRDRLETMIYLRRLTVVFREYCPAALPPDLPRLVAGEFVDMDAMTGSRDEMAAAGLTMLLEGLQTLADPGTAMRGAMRTDEIQLAADGDAQVLLGSLGCGSPELREMFANLRAHVRDPLDGVPPSQRSLVDICRAANPGGGGYCACAAPGIEAQAPSLARYLRSGAPGAWQHVPTLDRPLGERLMSCQR